jgi:ABC-2 type transport system permease protein
MLFKLTWVELKLFIREPLTLVFTFALPVIFLLVMGSVFGNKPTPGIYSGVGAVNYYNPAYIALTLSSIGIVALPVHLASYRERRVLRRFRASSISVWTVLGSQVLVTFVLAILTSVLLTIISMFTYHVGLPKDFGLLVPAFILGTLCFSSVCFLLGAVLPNTRAAQGFGLIIFFVTMILGGAGPPREVFNTAMLYISNATPTWHVIKLLQGPWLGFGWNTEASLVVACITVVSTALAARFFRWE